MDLQSDSSKPDGSPDTDQNRPVQSELNYILITKAGAMTPPPLFFCGLPGCSGETQSQCEVLTRKLSSSWFSLNPFLWSSLQFSSSSVSVPQWNESGRFVLWKPNSPLNKPAEGGEEVLLLFAISCCTRIQPAEQNQQLLLFPSTWSLLIHCGCKHN